MVVNPQGFIKYSTIFEGNMQDCTTLKIIVNHLRSHTSHSAKKGIVVIDAGIATDENLAMLTENFRK
jgi:transposase